MNAPPPQGVFKTETHAPLPAPPQPVKREPGGGTAGEGKARPGPAFPKAVVRVAGSDREFPNRAPPADLGLTAEDLKRRIESHDPAVDTAHLQRSKQGRTEWNFRFVVRL